MSGFSYNGIHCSAFNCEYIPDEKDRWFKESAFKIYDNDVSWKHGGYYYGNRAKVRQIKLKCYFEEITQATREKIRRWLGRNTKGKLIFDERPFVYYNVRPADVPDGDIYNDTGKYSGTFTVTFNVYNPFGYLTRKANTGSENDHAEDYCGLILQSMMPSAPTLDSRSFMVYNPGTEACGLNMVIAGSASHPIRFVNERNNSVCAISSFPTSAVLDIRGDTAFVAVKQSVNSSSYDNGFAYHDKGYVRLDPCETWTDVPYTAVRNGTTYNVTPTALIVTDDMIGGFIQFDDSGGAEAKIVSVNNEEGTLVCTLTRSGTVNISGTMRISTMNQITVQEQNNNGNWVAPTSLTFTTLQIDYQPRVL